MRANNRSKSKRAIAKTMRGIGDGLVTNSEGVQPPHVSGVYIRNLVKQLTSTRTTTTNPKQQNQINETKNMTIQQNKPPQQHKKQVRRRLHTTRPYQDKLLNMAEARREIVTALKFHRAAMKQANEKQQQQLSQTPSLSCDLEQEQTLKSRRNLRIYPSSTTNFYKNNDDNNNNLYDQVSPMAYPIWYNSQSNFVPSCDQNLNNFNFPLPNQPLGLNLNFHDFNIEATNIYSNPTSSASSSSSLSTSSPPTIATATDFAQEVKPMLVVPEEVYHNGGMHQVIDDEEMAEMRTIGDQHQMEWNDKMNLVTSAWWFKFLHTIETGPDGKTEDDHENNSYSYIDYCNPFDEIMEFPSWLNPNDDSSFDQPHFDDYCSPEYYTDPSLPCMEIGEFEGMDGEWLA